MSDSSQRPPLGNWREEERRVQKARARRSRWMTLAAVVVVGLAVAGVWRVLSLPAPEGSGPNPPGMPSNPVDRRSPAADAGADASGYSDRILQCTAADGSTFYTNASDCDAADTSNRVTVVPAHESGADASVGQNCVDSSREGRASHRFLGACQEPFSEALELERYLALAEDPAASPRAESYCALIAQGVNAGCLATNAQFCFLRICQQRLENPAKR
ncbi:hypothetical protein F3N42_09115 [Marinihelvus fidelis]|uniref:DUF4124 domain-containing protein n=1 Tax=Marinihelvus fidelis TaxID=2613842 RepID=A0A5N0T9R1_9GAMM|nr:hypothetical protein [Marinihelvus fidelis]KAA9131468.1 hypothetical protein F3N42_09115 [Marinihelvus fidelis]